LTTEIANRALVQSAFVAGRPTLRRSALILLSCSRNRCRSLSDPGAERSMILARRPSGLRSIATSRDRDQCAADQHGDRACKRPEPESGQARRYSSKYVRKNLRRKPTGPAKRHRDEASQGPNYNLCDRIYEGSATNRMNAHSCHLRVSWLQRQ
jgi:hypothetical protein